MTITTLSSREFNQDASRAKKAASNGPVFITDRGRPVHVLLTIEDYQRLAGGGAGIADLLAMPEAAEIEFEAPRLAGGLSRPVSIFFASTMGRSIQLIEFERFLVVSPGQPLTACKPVSDKV